jgi:heat shock protein HslJ
VPVLPGSEITATFAAGRITGNGGCNTYGAGYSLAGAGGTAIAIEPPVSTRVFCADPPGVTEQESAYFAALSTASAYRIEGDSLMLAAADGARVATFVAAGT